MIGVSVIESTVQLRIVLTAPPSGVAFGIQEGKGNDYKTIQIQESRGDDVAFCCSVTVKNNRTDGLPNFLGPLTQGPTGDRFIYIDVGKRAKQICSPWDRRIKIPLTGISWDLIGEATKNPKLILEARFPGTAKDGGPSCATLRPTKDWTICK